MYSKDILRVPLVGTISPRNLSWYMSRNCVLRCQSPRERQVRAQKHANRSMLLRPLGAVRHCPYGSKYQYNTTKALRFYRGISCFGLCEVLSFEPLGVDWDIHFHASWSCFQVLAAEPATNPMFQKRLPQGAYAE